VIFLVCAILGWSALWKGGASAPPVAAATAPSFQQLDLWTSDTAGLKPRPSDGQSSGASQGSTASEKGQAASNEALDEAQRAIEENRLDEALRKCQEVLEVDPKSARAYYLVGIIQAQRGATEEAKQAFLNSARIDPSRIGTHIYLGKLYVSSKEWSAAKEEFQAALKIDPSHIGTHIYLGQLYLSSKEWNAAKEEFEAALKLGDKSGAAEYGLALSELVQSNNAAGLPHLLAAVEADPKDPERLFTLIGAELHLKQRDNARNHLTQLQNLYPDDAFLAFRVGKLLKDQNMPLEAQAQFEQAIALLEQPVSSPAPADVSLPDVYLELARLRLDRHDYRRTLEYLDRIESSRLEPQVQAELLYLRGATYLSVGEAQEAGEKFHQAAEVNPDAPDYYFRWAWAELLAGNIDAASCATELARHKWGQLPNLLLMGAILEGERRPERARIPFKADWHLKGEGLVCCPCTTPCPCRSNAPPTEGHCENTGVVRIREGRYANISLDGLTFAAVHASMGEASAPTSVYVNSSATDEQLIALERIFQTFNPLRPFLFPSVQRTPITVNHSPEEKTYDVQIPQVLQIKIQRRWDSRGHPLLQTAAIDYFSNTLEYARNLTYKLWDPDGALRWDYSKRQANYRTIDLDSRAYWEGKMLIQYVDGSGFFNQEQLDLIKSQNLPTLREYPRPTQ
jgi:Tfp pilus assembly protein PilF